jgi:CubicO group peptidase (beta-lactamase class C family)
MFFPPTELTRAEIVQRLRYVRPSTSFRSRYNYDNILYIVAGQVVEAVSGVSWDQFLKDRIFTPLGMTATVTSVKEFKPGTDYASPHAKGDTKLQPVELSQADNWGAAAAIQSSVEDMAKWVAVQLDRGDMGGGKRLFSAAQSREMWTPQTLLPSREPSGPTAAIAPNMSAYALGWNVSDYRGKKMIHHTGGLAGMVTRVTLIPDLKLGVMVFTNQEVGAAFNAVTYTALDYYLGATGTDWVAVLGEQARKQAADAESAVAAAAAKRNANSKPSLPLTSYAGRYRDPWYGDVLVEEKEGRLAIRFTHSPVLVGFLEHFQYDTFVARWNDRTLLADAYMTFSLKDDGTIDAVKMRAVSPATDFSYDFHDLDLRPAPKDAKPY